MVATVVYFVYLGTNEFETNILVEGSITAIFFILGTTFFTLAIGCGPGGPVNALNSTQIIY